MMLDTSVGIQIDKGILCRYFKRLVNHFFKILPMRENNEDSLTTYMKSLQSELLGCQEFIIVLKQDSNYLTMLSILQYLIDNPTISITQVRREVFRAISICNKLESAFSYEEVPL